jgi:hypothetical protein
LSLVNSKRKSP